MSTKTSVRERILGLQECWYIDYKCSGTYFMYSESKTQDAEGTGVAKVSRT